MHLTAQLLALTANVHRDPKKRRQPYEASDFLPKPPVTEADVEINQRWTETLAEMRANYAKRLN